jgi:hypothetical protein
MAENRSFTVLVATVFAILFSTHTGAQTSSPVGRYQGVEVNLYQVWNSNSGMYDYFVVAIPEKGRPNYPVILWNAPYTVMPAPPSRNNIDAVWTATVHTNAIHYDVSLRPSWRFYGCNTPNGDCPIAAVGTMPLADLSSLANISGDVSNNTLLDQMFQDGYAVAVVLNGFYRANDAVSMMVGVRNALFTLANNPKIDRRRRGLIGRSLGGELAIHPLAFPSDDLHIAATIFV